MRLLLVAVMLTAPAVARSAPSEADISAYRALVVQDARLATTGFRLAKANAAFCKFTQRNPGWVLHSYRAYPDREIAQAAFAFPTPVSLSVVVPGGPADAAGLKAGDGLQDMGRDIFWGGELKKHRPSSELVDTISLRLKELFSGPGPVALSFRTPLGAEKQVKLDPPPICASGFWVDTQSKLDAGADGDKVRVTSAMMDYVADDQELAAVVAHELSHNLLGHRARLDQIKRDKTKAVLATEIEADRLSVWLMANAGYDPGAALRFWERYGRRFIIMDRSHPNWKSRIASMQVEIDLIAKAQPTDSLRDPPLLQAYRDQQ
jgi:beta-barrel assembly-enhancing protease